MIQVGGARFRMRLNGLLHPLKLNEESMLCFVDPEDKRQEYFYRYTGQLNGPFGKVHSILCLAFLSNYLPYSQNKIIHVQVERFINYSIYPAQFKTNHPIVFLYVMLFQNKIPVRWEEKIMGFSFEDFLLLDRQFAHGTLMHSFLNWVAELEVESINPQPVYNELLNTMQNKTAEELYNNILIKRLLGFIELMDFVDNLYDFLQSCKNRLIQDCLLNIYRVEIFKMRHSIGSIYNYFSLLLWIRSYSSDTDIIINKIEDTQNDFYSIESISKKFHWLINQKTDHFVKELLSPMEIKSDLRGRSLILSETSAVLLNN